MSRNSLLALAIVLTALTLGAPGSAPGAGSLGSGGEYDAYDERPYAFIKGAVSADDGWRVVVNEGTRVRIDTDTELLDVRGRRAGRDELRPGGWIYAEGPVGYGGDVQADKVYLLPGPVRPGEYPFIQAP